MKRFAAALAFLAFSVSVNSQTSAANRPRILGIDHVAFYTTSPDGVKKLYGGVLGFESGAPVESGGLVRYMIGRQWVGYSAAPDPKATDRMDHVAFTTDNIVALRKYLTANGVKASWIQGRSDHSLFFVVADPEGHRIEFVERGKPEPETPAASALSRHMLHAGFLVQNREAEDHFYKDILGFHLYWHWGQKPDTTDWAAMQVPDGTDWLEYMLNQPEHPHLQLTGTMNSTSGESADRNKAQAILESHGWKPQGDEAQPMGKEGR